MRLELAVDEVTCCADLTAPDAEPTNELLSILPLVDVTFVPTCWSGAACEIDLSTTGYTHPKTSVFSLGCSLYPGMLALRRDRKMLEISYGAAEARSAEGVQYVFVVARLDVTGGTRFMNKLASTHDAGALHGSIKVVRG